MAKQKERIIEYSGKKWVVLNETLNFYYLAEQSNADNTLNIAKKDYAAYQKETVK